MEHCIKAAEDNHLKKIIIYSNRRLDLQFLYENMVWEIPLDGVYERADIKMEKLIERL
jgi:hypothetical protein